MTILFNQQCPEFDRDPALKADDRAQPIGVEAGTSFVVLTQQDGTNEMTHCIIVEYRDVEPLIEALRRCVCQTTS